MAQNSRAALIAQRIAVYNRAHPDKPIDPRAALAVARQEGLSGKIGDSGHAFGDFQLNDAGGVLTGKFPGWTPQQKQAWADSPTGLDYALAGIGRVSGGQHDEQAIRSIVSRFERPADIPGEIARALGNAGGNIPAGATAGTAPTGAAPPAGIGPMLLQAIMRARNATGNEGPGAAITQLLSGPTRQAAPAPQRAPTAATPLATAGHGAFAELLHEGVGGSTHSTGEHIHFASADPQTVLAAIRQAQALGLNVRENPYTDPVDPVHAKRSYHYRTFPGKYNGRSLGQAGDASGSPAAMRKLYALLAARR